MIFAIIEFFTLIPFLLMCFLPVMKYCIIKNKFFIPAVITITALLSVVLGVVKVVLYVRPIMLMAPFLAVFLLLYFALFDFSQIKLWYIFISAIAIMTFVFSISLLIESIFNDSSKRENVMTYGLIVEVIVEIMFFVLLMLCKSKIQVLLDDYYLNSLWKAIWLVPAFITLANMFMMPVKYSNTSIVKMEDIYVVLVLCFLYLLFQVLLYYVAKITKDKSLAEQRSQISKSQVEQYKNLKKYIEDTSRLRHDFLHTARTAVALAQNNDIDTLVKFLEDYGVSVENSHVRQIFCEHDALNAIIAYYYDIARKHDIKCIWQVAIPNDINISDVELCSIVGNLLNNAIQGALTAPEDKRYISFKADLELNNDIYIVASNSFDGVVKKDNGKYSTTKSYGHGIGLESIETTVAKNNGYVKFYNDNDNFYTDIMMHPNKTNTEN